MEDRLLGHPEGVVAGTVELLRRQPAEVTDTRQRDGDEAVEELPHPVTTQRHLGADRHPFAQLELGDGLLRAPDRGLLTGDGRKIPHSAIDQLRVPGGVSDPHVDDDLDDAGDLHDVAVGELVPQRRGDLVTVPLLEPWNRASAGGPAFDGPALGGHSHGLISFPNCSTARSAYSSVPVRRETRTLVPSSLMR